MRNCFSLLYSKLSVYTTASDVSYAFGSLPSDSSVVTNNSNFMISLVYARSGSYDDGSKRTITPFASFSDAS